MDVRKKLLNQKFLFKKSFRIYQQKSACQAWKKKLHEIWLSWVSMISLREYIIQRVLYYYRIWFSIIKWIYSGIGHKLSHNYSPILSPWLDTHTFSEPLELSSYSWSWMNYLGGPLGMTKNKFQSASVVDPKRFSSSKEGMQQKVPCGRLRGCTFDGFFLGISLPKTLPFGGPGRVRFPGSPKPNAIDPRWQHHEAGGTQGALSGETGEGLG